MDKSFKPKSNYCAVIDKTQTTPAVRSAEEAEHEKSRQKNDGVHIDSAHTYVRPKSVEN